MFGPLIVRVAHRLHAVIPMKLSQFTTERNFKHEQGHKKASLFDYHHHEYIKLKTHSTGTRLKGNNYVEKEYFVIVRSL